MRKIFSLSLILCLMITALAACGGKDNATTSSGGAETAGSDKKTETTDTGSAKGDGPSGKLVFLTNRTDMIGKQYDDYKKRFEEKYPDVDLQFEAITDYDKNVKIRISSGEYPDVVFIPTIPNADLPKYFEPLDDMSFSGDLYFKDAKVQDGKMYGISSGASTVGIVYNKKAFEKAGITEIPKTYDEFLAICEKLKSAGIIPLASNFKDKWPLDTWVYDVPSIISGKTDHEMKRAETDTPYTMDNEYGKSWSILRELQQKGYLEKDVNSTNWEQSKKDIAQGKMAMYLLGNWVINQVIENGAPSEDVGFFPFPADNSGQYKAPLNPDFFYAVNKNGNVKAAKAFVQWMMEESGYEDFAGFIPVLKNKEPKLAQLAEFNSYKPQFLEAVFGDDTATAIQNKAQIDQQSMVQEFVLSKDPQKVLDKYDAAWAKAKKALGK